MVRRKDSKNRVLKEGESERKNGTYEYKYRDITGKRKSVYAKTLDELREKEELIKKDLADGIIPNDLTVYQLVEEYLSQKSSIKYNTMQCYKCALRRLKGEPFSATKIDKVKPMDLKSFFKKLQDENGLGFTSIDEMNKIMKPAFRMAFENDLIRKNPFRFSLSDVVKNESKKREAITKSQMESFLQFIKEDKKYSKYYNGIYILFHTGLRISDYHVIIGLNQLETAKYKGFRKIWSYDFLQRNSQSIAERRKKLNKVSIIGLIGSVSLDLPPEAFRSVLF